MEPRRGRSREAGPGPRLGRRPGRLAEQLFGQLSLLPSPHTHLGLSAGPLTLTSRTHPQASPSSLPVQATSRGLLHQPPCCLWALWLQPSRLTAPSPHSRWTEPALLRLSLPGMKPGLWGPTHLGPTDLLISTELTPLSSHRPFWSSNSPASPAPGTFTPSFCPLGACIPRSHSRLLLRTGHRLRRPSPHVCLDHVV